MIPLVLDFSQEPPEGIRFQAGKILLNTKDPAIGEKIQNRLMDEVDNKEELHDLETLYINHRLRMAEDLDMFDNLENVIDIENRKIEEKSDFMQKMSMTMTQAQKTAKDDSVEHSNTLIVDVFEGFAE